jgi:Tfp pilus assembly protein PilF
MGDLENAITKYRLAVSLITDDSDLFSTFGFVLGKKGRWKDAITNFEKAVGVSPGSLEYANLGWALLQSAVDNRSLRYFDREKADLERARIALAKAVEIDDKNVAAQLNLGSVLNDLGQSADALKSLKRRLRQRFKTVREGI